MSLILLEGGRVKTFYLTQYSEQTERERTVQVRLGKVSDHRIRQLKKGVLVFIKEGIYFNKSE